MSNKRGFDHWLATHPRQTLQLGFVLLIGVWQVAVALTGVLLYLLLTRLLRLRWWWVLASGTAIAAFTLVTLEHPVPRFLPKSHISFH